MTRAPRLTSRDHAILAAVGRFRMLTRKQVKRWFFREVSEPVVTGVLARLARHGWLGIERLAGNGIQVLWLSPKGRDLLVDQGQPVFDLFPARGPVPAKDFAHTIEIGNAAVWLMERVPPPDELLPAWQLQRLYAGRLRAIPDLLAVWRASFDQKGAVLAVEVDLGTEGLQSVFVPKLTTLRETLGSLFPGLSATVLVLVPSKRRTEALMKLLPGAPFVVELLGSLNSES